MAKKNKKGMGERQIADSAESREAILKVLSDGEWHQYKELKEKAELSNVTLSRHLKKLKKALLKKEGEKDSRIVYYKMKNSYLIFMAILDTAQELWQRFRKTLVTTKNPLLALKEINTFNNISTLGILKILKETTDTDQETLNFLMQLNQLASRFLTYSLIKESMKILDEVDIDQLVKSASAEIKPKGE